MKWYIKSVIVFSFLGAICSVMAMVFNGVDCVCLSLLTLSIVNGIGSISKYREEFVCIEEEYDVEERIQRFIEQLDFEIDKEDENVVFTPEAAIRKSSYQHAYWKCKNALQNILAGREFNENEPE